MAQHVVSYFHKTYLGTSKLIIELAFSKKSNSDNGTYRPWSKYSAGSSKYDSIHNIVDQLDKDKDEDKNNIKNAARKDEKKEIMDKKKEEFLSVMMGSKKGSGKMWDNDDGDGIQEVVKSVSSKRATASVAKNDGRDDDKSTDSSSSDTSSDSSSDSDSDSDDDKNDDNQKSKESSEQKQQAEGQQQVEEEDEPPTEEYSSDRLFVRNLPFHATQEEVKEVFDSFGEITECHIPVDDSDRNKGYAFVKFSSSQDAIQAMEQLDGSSFQGRLIHVLPARPERDDKDSSGNADGNKNATGMSNEEGGGELTFKKKMELARQKDAANTTTGWSTNFVRGDAVVDNLADRFGMDKGAVFDVKDGLSAGNAAVRLALGETQILEENKEYFKNHGIQMDALVDEAAKRSSKMILVKNLPYDTTYEELAKLFLAFGGDANILLPPSRTIALIDFKTTNSAKKVFRKLAYKRFKHVPLYLEWAPLSIKIESSKSEKTIDASASDATPAPQQTNVVLQEDKEEDDDTEEAQQGSASIYVKNLKFSTTEDEVQKVFESVIGKNVRSVRIPTKAAPVKASKNGPTKNTAKVQQMSLGYGFVECNSVESAQKAIKLLQGKDINGHAMELKFSSKSSTTSTKSSNIGNKKSTKLMVRNVPFQASRTDILQLFGSFGQLKTVRLPKKFDGGHRGFAFVHFTAAKEAQNAMKTLANTHLYGRHLVIEWADDKEDIDTLRSKVKRDAGFSSSSAGNGKNKKIRFS
jgi:multiple RNA-binding domain-containing protein 1